jgi:hypothetical protein
MPVEALDLGAGYEIAAAAIRGLAKPTPAKTAGMVAAE